MGHVPGRRRDGKITVPGGSSCPQPVWHITFGESKAEGQEEKIYQVYLANRKRLPDRRYGRKGWSDEQICSIMEQQLEIDRRIIKKIVDERKREPK